MDAASREHDRQAMIALGHLPADSDGESRGPADWLRQVWDWPLQLDDAGWALHSVDRNGDQHWTRPGKDRRLGNSATLHPDGAFNVFSTADELAALRATGRPGRGGVVSVTPIQFYAAREHDGDVSAAARHLREMATYVPDLSFTPKPMTMSAGTPPSTETVNAVAQRQVTVTAASAIQPRPVRWLWRGRVALGTLALIGGREGIGKSLVTYEVVAKITRGLLPGIHLGTPRAVLVCATEDSWDYTIVPRLMAADADLDRVYRIDVTTSEGVAGALSLPADIAAIERIAAEVDAAAIVLDPLLSRLSTNLDTHKDAEVRVALEPLVALADRADVAILGLIHVNKSNTVDPLTMLMASRAFAAVARAVLFVAVDPEDESGRRRYLGEPKNNLGVTDLPLLTFTIESKLVATTHEGEVWTSHVVWQGDDPRSIADVLRTAADQPADRSEVDECAGWLGDYLSIERVVLSDAVKAAAKKFGHKEHTVKRARQRIGAGITSHGFPRRTWWSHPDLTPDEVTEWLRQQSEQPADTPVGTIPGESEQSVLTVLTDRDCSSSETVGTVGTPLENPRVAVPTGESPVAPDR